MKWKISSDLIWFTENNERRLVKNGFQTDIGLNFNFLHLSIWYFSEGRIIAKVIQQNIIVRFQLVVLS